jgi:flagellar hook-length control protein FliK
MSLLPASLSTPAPAPSSASSASSTSSACSHGDESSQGEGESFGDVLSRSLAASGEASGKPGGKPSATGPAKRPADEKNDQPEAINTAALLFVPLETRVAKAASGDGDSNTANTAGATTSTLTATPAAEGLKLAPASPSTATATTAAATDTTLAGDAETQAPQALLASPVASAKGPQASAPTLSSADEPAITLPTTSAGIPAAAPHGRQEEQPSGHEQRPGDEAREVLGTDTRAEQKNAATKASITPSANDRYADTPANAALVLGQAGSGQGPETAATAAVPGFNHSTTPLAIHANAASPSPAAPTASTHALAPEVGTHAWGEALGRQMLHMGKAGEQVAELQLNPPGLGPLKVTLSLNDNQVQAFFVSAHASVRAAVEAALPQLRGSLADNGISLGNTSVDSGSQQQQQQAFTFFQGQDSRPPSGERGGRQGYPAADAQTPASMAATSTPRRGKVDTYA